MSTDLDYRVERYGAGYIAVDYSGKRGSHGVAFAGTDGEWLDQPVLDCPFDTEDAASEFLSTAKES